MLIATLPPVYREDLLREIASNEAVSEVRYNTGMTSPWSAKETLQKVAVIARSKRIWIDLKGRQLRIAQWALPDYAKIVLNHEVVIEGAARAVFRDDETYDIRFANKNVIYLDGSPRRAVGAGQSLNIIGENVRIKGYLTDGDREYIEAAKELGIDHFMLSFVEGLEDIGQTLSHFPDSTKPHFGLKIESVKGIDFVEKLAALPPNCRLVAARDDLYTTIGDDKMAMLDALEAIIVRDSAAIVASRIFKGLETGGSVSLADLCDIELMRRSGYQRFMLSDEICQRHFAAAIAAWNSFTARYPELS